MSRSTDITFYRCARPAGLSSCQQMATQMPLFFAGGAYDELADKAELVAISAMAGDFDRGGIDDAKQFRFVADVDGLF